ncbi:MAG TPA: hypothetical protein VL752_04665 [Acidisoma sp.]|jgi:hypothetical protein|uniref:hypothetical protein n=1 Tax=Acidisoma sp. TaxID=1872115 RepID=UPI002BAB57D9|nr:hypothetical protein [Acidisoma sp.]HTI00221.1 hypothetical protein [Acidisoma sp.]
MKSKTIERLDLLTATRELRLLEEIGRQNGLLEQAARQREILAGYREKLARSWRGGAVIEAGGARRAAAFITASDSAESQIVRMEAQAAEALKLAQTGFAHAQEHRANLAEARRSLTVLEERRAEQRRERAQAGPFLRPRS